MAGRRARVVAPDPTPKWLTRRRNKRARSRTKARKAAAAQAWKDSAPARRGAAALYDATHPTRTLKRATRRRWRGFLKRRGVGRKAWHRRTPRRNGSPCNCNPAYEGRYGPGGATLHLEWCPAFVGTELSTPAPYLDPVEDGRDAVTEPGPDTSRWWHTFTGPPAPDPILRDTGYTERTTP